jgi:hypothetical protein
MKVSIHNQCSDFKLTNGRYFSSGVDWIEELDKEIDSGNMTSVSLIPFLATFDGVLMYELQSKHLKLSNQFKPTYIQFLVAWKFEDYKNFCALIRLIAYDKQIKWNMIKFKEYYRRCVKRLHTYTNPIKDAWLVHDDTVLETVLELDFTQRDGVLNITISEGFEDGHIRMPVWIDPKM